MTRPKSQNISKEPATLENAVVDLTDEVKALSGQVEILRISIDDLRQEVEWAIRNMPRQPWAPSPALTSMSKDPCGPDFAERINRFTAANLAPAEKASKEPAPAAQETAQGTLWG